MRSADNGTDICLPIRIGFLADVPEAVPTLADWFREEWQPWYGRGGKGDAERDLNSCCNRDALPIALVALAHDDTLLGTAALKAESLGSEVAPGPWLAAFLVGRAYRHKGIGGALVGGIEALARRLGFATLYASTDTARALLERCQWQAFEEAISVRGPVRVFRKHL